MHIHTKHRSNLCLQARQSYRSRILQNQKDILKNYSHSKYRCEYDTLDDIDLWQIFASLAYSGSRYKRGLSSTTGFRHAINFSSEKIGSAHFCSVSLTLMGFISSLLDVGAWLWVREYVALANAIRIRRYLERTKVTMIKSTAFVQ